MTMWKPAPYVGILVGSIERAFHFSRRRISWMWFYRLSSELYFAKTGAREEPDRTRIRNYEWETSPATVLISSASCNFSSESGKALSVFIATLGPWKRKRPLFTRNSSFYCHYPSDANCYKKVHKSESLISFKGKRGIRRCGSSISSNIYERYIPRGLIRRKVHKYCCSAIFMESCIFNLSSFMFFVRFFFFSQRQS